MASSLVAAIGPAAKFNDKTDHTQVSSIMQLDEVTRRTRRVLPPQEQQSGQGGLALAFDDLPVCRTGS
jgi:hypothetical protein